ncbi:aminopeptidase N [Streptomyces sp. NPDC059506]|uniref:aminopeptidase N n=1 Tax=Streptomyces sp. NPDC059506 TaxID=3347751 RepID=UPI0036C74429
MPALTRAEAAERARILDVRSYTVDLDLTRGEETFGSTTTIRFTCAEPGATTFLDVKPGRLHRAVLNGRDVDPATWHDGRLPLPALAADNLLHIEADMRYSHTGEGMHRFTDPADGRTYLYSHCFLDEAPRIFAAFDQPDLKAAFHLTVTAPEDWTVLANGTTTRTAPGRWHAAPTPPVSTYLFAVAAGPYHTVRAEHAGLPLGLHCRRSLAPHLDADADEILDITRRCLDRYHEIFDEPYPFDSYDQAFVPEFNPGAMENPGLVTFREEYVFRSAVTDTERQTRGVTIAHEMAHMWFGDLVTMRWWDDLWLNESFAEYMGYRVLAETTRHTGTWTEFAASRKPWGYDADQRPSTHPVAPDDVPDTAAALLNFDGISYAKGASALRQLVALLGDTAFLAGVNDHFARHRFANASLADLLDSLTRASGHDVHAWARAWLRTTGVDTLRAEPAADGTVRVVRDGTRPHRITVATHTRPALPGTPGSTGTTRATRTTATGTLDDTTPALDLPAPAGPAGTALLLPNADDLTYAKIRLDPDSWTTATRSLGELPDPLDRALLWTCARDMVRDGELAPADYLDLASRHLPAETDTSVIAGILAFARGPLADTYLHPGSRPRALAGIGAVCLRLLDRTAAVEDGTGGRTGGDTAGVRLSAVRGIVDAALTEEDTARLREWLTDGRVPGGPPLDPELRWRTLLRLCVLGAAGEDDIAAELRRDPSATGHEGADRCRAALPDPRAKDAAWKALFEHDELSNYRLVATAQGFWQPEQADILAARVPHYFPAATEAAARRGAAVAEALGRHAFPAHAVHPDTLAAGEKCLHDGGTVPALRRALADRLDDLSRALDIRTRHPH